VKFLGSGPKICLDRVEIQLSGTGRRGLGKKVEYLRAGTGRLGQQIPTPAETGQHRLTHAGRAHSAQHRVKGITAFLKQYPGRVRGLLVPRRHSPQRIGQIYHSGHQSADMLTQSG